LQDILKIHKIYVKLALLDLLLVHLKLMEQLVYQVIIYLLNGLLVQNVHHQQKHVPQQQHFNLVYQLIMLFQ